jgi:hypothetical protein
MFRLAAIIYVLVSAALAGAFVTALLSANILDRMSLAGAAVGGAVVAVPIAWLIARQMLAVIRR